MVDAKTRMQADRALRNSARTLMQQDYAHLKGDLARKGVKDRAVDRVRGGAMDVYDEAMLVAENNKGALAALGAAIVVWFARNPLLSAVGVDRSDDRRTDDE